MIQQWEYKHETITIGLTRTPLREGMANLGKQGWEIFEINVDHGTYGHGITYYELFAKRRLN